MWKDQHNLDSAILHLAAHLEEVLRIETKLLDLSAWHGGGWETTGIWKAHVLFLKLQESIKTQLSAAYSSKGLHEATILELILAILLNYNPWE